MQEALDAETARAMQGDASSILQLAREIQTYAPRCMEVAEAPRTSCFPECVARDSKGSRFTPGVWGLRVCSLDVAFTFATVRNRPRYCYMAVPMVSSAEGVVFGCFWRFQTSRFFVSRGRRGTS